MVNLLRLGRKRLGRGPFFRALQAVLLGCPQPLRSPKIGLVRVRWQGSIHAGPLSILPDVRATEKPEQSRYPLDT